MVNIDVCRTVESDLLGVGKPDGIATGSNEVYKYTVPFLNSCRDFSILNCGFINCCTEDTKSRGRQAESVQIRTIPENELRDPTPQERISSTFQTLQDRWSVPAFG
jgi:hypothetical protein